MSAQVLKQAGDIPDVPLLSFQNVVKDYTAESALVRALHGVSFEVTAGEFVALVGRSGCGKSTLLHLAGALDFPTSGHVLVDGFATDALDERGLTQLRREKVGFIFQSFQLLHTLSVVENIEVSLMLAGEARPRAAALERLEWVGLGGFAHRQVHQLSGGQMQRAAIARALVHGPRLLLADEPTGNLDTATGNAILDLLVKIATERNVAVVMATHSAEAAAVASRVVRMRDGRIEDDLRRTPSEVRQL